MKMEFEKFAELMGYTAADVVAKANAQGGINATLFNSIALSKFMYQKTDLTSSNNLNNITTTGVYHNPASANATTANNYPVAGLAGMLEVFASGQMIYQRYTSYSTDHIVYVRTYYNGNWYSWNKLLDNNHDVNATTLNGQNASYYLPASNYNTNDIISKLVAAGLLTNVNVDKVDGHHAADFLLATQYTASDVVAKANAQGGINATLFNSIALSKFMYVNSTVIPNAADFNTFQTNGIYICTSNTYAATCINIPEARAGFLEVIGGLSGQYLQRYTIYDNHNMYIRTLQSGTWTSWYKVWTSGNDGSGSGVDADTVDNKHLNEIISLIYPVGAVYISAVNTNPSTLFGGTWEQIKDKFILSAGDTYSAGATGGEANHTLSAAEMPVHKHDVSVPSSGASTTGSGGVHTHLGYYIADTVTNGASRRLVSNQYGATSVDEVNASAGAHTHSTPNHSHTVSESNKGSGSAHNNMPPYLAVYVWKRTA